MRVYVSYWPSFEKSSSFFLTFHELLTFFLPGSFALFFCSFMKLSGPTHVLLT